MKKQIVMLLCTAVLALGLTAIPAMASAEPYSPIEVEAYTYGPLDEPRINKVYRLPATDDPAGIPTEEFERGGRRYYLLDMTIANSASFFEVAYVLYPRDDPRTKRLTTAICAISDPKGEPRGSNVTPAYIHVPKPGSP